MAPPSKSPTRPWIYRAASSEGGPKAQSSPACAGLHVFLVRSAGVRHLSCFSSTQRQEINRKEGSKEEGGEARRVSPPRLSHSFSKVLPRSPPPLRASLPLLLLPSLGCQGSPWGQDQSEMWASFNERSESGLRLWLSPSRGSPPCPAGHRCWLLQEPSTAAAAGSSDVPSPAPHPPPPALVSRVTRAASGQEASPESPGHP